jgi:hypothetical protein
MPTTTIPSSLYKYLCACRAVQVLCDLRIRLSQVSVLNDVDEFQLQYNGFSTRTETKRIAREFLLRKYPSECANVYRNLPLNQADQAIDAMARNGADNLEEGIRKGKIVRDLYAKYDRDYGLLSLSETISSKLMWSFYGDGGWGIAIEFAPSDAWFNSKTAKNDSFHHLRKVEYVTELKPMLLLDTRVAVDEREDTALYTKTIEWGFEKEWRIIRKFAEAQEKSGLDRYGKEVWLFGVPPSAIRSVILGYRTTHEKEKALREKVSENADLKHVVFRRAVRDVDGKIEIVPDGTGTNPHT